MVQGSFTLPGFRGFRGFRFRCLEARGTWVLVLQMSALRTGALAARVPDEHKSSQTRTYKTTSINPSA